MSADSMYSDDWNSCLTGSQINAWNLEDEIARIGSKADDFLSGVLGSESSVSEANYRRKARSNEDASNPFRRFQTPPPGRTSPTPLSELYSQSIYQAEVDSDSWQTPESCNCLESTDIESSNFESTVTDDACPPNVKDVECMPQDLFSFSQQEAKKTGEPAQSKAALAESSLETLNRSLTEPEEKPKAEKVITSPAEELKSEPKGEYTPKLIVETTKEESERSAKRPLLSLSIGMSICGVGLVFGSQIMHNSAVINPGKSLIIAGLIGLFVSFAFQGVNLFRRRKTV